MQVFYSQFFPKEIAKELAGSGYSVIPFELKPSGNGIYELKGIPRELTEKTVFLVSDDNNQHGITYSLIRHIFGAPDSRDVTIGVNDAHLDWEDPLGGNDKHVSGWNFLSRVAELPAVKSIHNWGTNPEYEKRFDFQKPNGSNIKVESSSVLPDKKTISKIDRNGFRYLSHDLDVIGSESILDPALTGRIELKTSVADLILLTQEFQPDFMDIYLNPDENAQNVQKYMLETDLGNFLRLLEGIYSENKAILEKFRNNAEFMLETSSSLGFARTGKIPDFLKDASLVDKKIKNMLDSNEEYIKKLANHAYHSVPELCIYLLQAMDGKLDADKVNESFLHNVDATNLSRLERMSQLIERIKKEKYYGHFKPLMAAHPELRILIGRSDDGYFKALEEQYA